MICYSAVVFLVSRSFTLSVHNILLLRETDVLLYL